MRRLPIIRLVPFALALSVHAASAQQSQAPPPDPVEGAMVRLGPVGLNPSLLFRDIGRDTNVFNDATDPKSDFTATISPKLEVVVHPGPMLFSYTTQSDYIYYQTYTSERGTNLANAVRADFDFGIFKPYVSAGVGNTRDRLNREIDARARHRDANYGGGLRLQLFENVFATASARHSESTFDPDAEFRGQLLETTLNQKDDVADAGGGVALTPLTSLQVTVSRERTRFEFLPGRNSETLRITPTITFSPLAVLNGTASVGYRRFTAQSAEIPDYRGLVANVTLGANAGQRHHFDVNVGRDVQYSYEESVAEYVETGFTLGWNWQITGPIDTHITGGRSRLHYRSPNLTGSNTDDIAHSYGFSVGWHVKPYLRAAVNGDWRGRDSERSVDRTYDSRRIYATLTWGKV
jgi:hypothetical protein